jgi:hypothetical protein
MQTIIIKNVTVTAGTGPASGQNPTQIQADPINLTAGTDYTANQSTNTPLSPTAENVLFYQTLPASGEVPYAVRIRQSDPFTGTFYYDIPLSADAVEYGSYNAGADISLSTATPVQGLGGFQVVGANDNYVRTADPTYITAALAPSSGPEDFTVPPLTVASPAVSDSISGTFTEAKAGSYDSGFLIVTHKGAIVTTIPLASVLSQNSGTGGPYAITNLPGGSSSQAFQDGMYYLYARVWNSSNPAQSLHRESMPVVVDLRNGSATNVNFTVH